MITIIITEILNQLFFLHLVFNRMKTGFAENNRMCHDEKVVSERLAMGNKSVERRVGWETTR